jgi:hypothetical protein
MAFVSLAEVTGVDQTPMSPAESDSIIRRPAQKEKISFPRLPTLVTANARPVLASASRGFRILPRHFASGCTARTITKTARRTSSGNSGQAVIISCRVGSNASDFAAREMAV